MTMDASLDWTWAPEGTVSVIETIDMHTGGEPLRVISAGLPTLKGTTVLEKRRFFADNHDAVRTALMWEPRGHADMYGAVLSRSADGDFDVFFLHNEGYSTMCGHAIIALTRFVIALGLVPPDTEEIIFNVPAGRISAWPVREGGRIVASRFRNVASYVPVRDARIEVPGNGEVRFDIAYGGAYYAIVEAAPLGLALLPQATDHLIDMGRRIKQAIASVVPIVHPTEPELGFLYGTIFTGPAEDPHHHSRNVCIFADGEVDRSPTGSGVSARAALHHARGELQLGDIITIESIVGSTMSVQVVAEDRIGSHNAVIPEVEGNAYFTGRSRFWIEQDDAMQIGFLVR